MSLVRILEGERMLIGACLLAGSTQGTGLQPGDFARHAHRLIWETMQRIERCDLWLTANALGKDIDEAGGREYLVECCQEAVGTSQIPHYAGVVQSGSERRALVAAASAVAASDEFTPTEEMRANLEAALAGSPAKAPPVCHLRDINPIGKRRGVPTGIAGMDRVIETGGYPVGQMTIVSAYHKTGKSVFMLQSALSIARSGGRVLYATFADLNRDDIKRRLVRNWCGLEEPDMFDATQETLDVLPIDVYDASELDTGNDVETFCAVVRAEHAKDPLAAVFVDYAGELSSRDRRVTSEYAEHNVCASRIARLAAKLHDVAIVVGSQITEGGKEGRDRTKSSRGWEEKAGWVIRLKRSDTETRTECISVFSRFGGSGTRTSLRWNTVHAMYEEDR